MKKSGISNQAWVLCHDAKVPDISCVKALKAAHISSWTVSLAVLEDFFLKFLKDLQAKECWQVFWFSCLFSPWLGNKQLCYFLSSFPQNSLGKSMSSWVWRAVQHAESSSTQKMPEGHSASLQVAENDGSTIFSLSDTIIPPLQQGLLCTCYPESVGSHRHVLRMTCCFCFRK